jgi:POT family proton-dependent oligopeptide transporter
MMEIFGLYLNRIFGNIKRVQQELSVIGVVPTIHLWVMIPNHPRGLAYIIGNEAAERFSYYGMKAILVVFMTTYLMDPSGTLRVMTEGEATFWYHIFGMANYVVPIVGALVADALWGKYKTIIALSLVYCLGHLALALDETRLGLGIGLALIAIGSGGIKPCVSAHLGDQYRNENVAYRSEGYSLFYIAINFGAFVSTLITPLLLEWYGPNIAFGVPGILMALATYIFWRGRRLYVVQPPTQWRSYLRELIDAEHRLATARVLLLFVALSVFWALFDQTGSSWVFQAERMNREIVLPFVGTYEVVASQIQALNPILILVLAPLSTWVIYPWLERRGLLSTRGKIATGMLAATLAFGIVGYAQRLITAGGAPSMWWQISALFILTSAEVVVSITALELAYTSAPTTRRSLMTSFYLLSVALGNGVTALIVGPLRHLVGAPSTEGYFYFFAVLPLVVLAPTWWILGKITTKP